MECPEPRPGEVRVRVQAAGVSLPDVMMGRSRKALRRGGRVVAYGLTGSLRGGRLASGRSGGRHRFRAIAIFALYIAGGWILPGRKRVTPYSIQWLKRLKPAFFREDLTALFGLLQQHRVAPLIAQRLPLAEVRRAHELLGEEALLARSCWFPRKGSGRRDTVATR